LEKKDGRETAREEAVQATVKGIVGKLLAPQGDFQGGKVLYDFGGGRRRDI